MSKRENPSIVWNGANHVVELALNGFQIIKNIRMVKTDIINNQRTRIVMHKFRTLVKKCSVIFIGFNHEIRALT